MKEKIKEIWGRSAYWVGMSLFVVSVAYSVYKAPDILWNLNPAWVTLAIVFILLLFVTEILQFLVFLRKHKIKLDLLIPIRFTTRKSILNSLLPAKTGTLLFLHLITRHYKLNWHEYVHFMLTATVLMLFVSVIAFLGLIIPYQPFCLLVLILSIITWITGRTCKWGYLSQVTPLLLVSVVIYGSRLLIFWALLQSTGTIVGFTEASYFAIVTNTLAQVSITPGNIGVREVILGVISPYLSLPISVGIIIGAVFQVLRIVIYWIILVFVDVFYHDRLSNVSIESNTSNKT